MTFISYSLIRTKGKYGKTVGNRNETSQVCMPCYNYLTSISSLLNDFKKNTFNFEKYSQIIINEYPPNNNLLVNSSINSGGNVINYGGTLSNKYITEKIALNLLSKLLQKLVQKLVKKLLKKLLQKLLKKLLQKVVKIV